MRLDHFSKANFENRARDSDRESCILRGSWTSDLQISGGDFEEATPDPIPNSEVKLLGADGTAREAVWESRTPPGFSLTSPATLAWLGFVLLCAVVAAIRKVAERRGAVRWGADDA